MFLRASARSPRGKITVVAASYLDICVLDDETITGPAHTHRERERGNEAFFVCDAVLCGHGRSSCRGPVAQASSPDLSACVYVRAAL